MVAGVGLIGESAARKWVLRAGGNSMHTGSKILAVIIGASLAGCTFEQASIEDVEQGATENVGSVTSAINVQAIDLPPAATVIRGVRTTINGIPTVRKDLYVFICDNHQIKVRWKGLFGWNFGGWQAIAPDYPCDSAPSAGVIHNTESNKQDILGVYWRSDRSLVEAWYRKDGTMAVLDLLDYDPSNIPAIDGSPMVSDTSDPTRIQVVVKRGTQVWTIKWTGSAYDAQRVLRADGTLFTTSANVFHTVYNAGNGREYISIEDTANGDHVIFSRGSASWHLSYTEYARVTSGVDGLLTVGGRSLLNGQTCAAGYAIRNNFLPEASCLDAGGTLTNWSQIGIGGFLNPIYGAPNGSSWLFGLRNGQISAFTSDPLFFANDTLWDATGVASAIVQPTGGSSHAFWAKNVNGTKRLMMADYTGTQPWQATVTELGGNLIY
jgi:hypothetical protein